MTYIRNGVGYNSEDEANLAGEIPSLYLDRATDAGYIAEAVLASDWLAAHDAETRRKALEDARAVLRENTALSLYEPQELTDYGKGERKALELADARLRALAEVRPTTL